MFRLVVAFLLICSSSFAQSISGVAGTFTTGNSVVISGSGFGLKSPAAPVLWDDFEAGTTGNPVTTAAIGGAWLRANNVEYTDAVSDIYSGSMSATSPVATYDQLAPGLIYRWEPGNRRGFFSAKVRYEFEGDAGQEANIKMFRLKYGNDGDYVHGYPFLSIDKVQTLMPFRQFMTNGQSSDCASPTYWYISSQDYTFMENWTYLEFWSEMGSLNTADGRFGGMMNGVRGEFTDITIYANECMRDVEYGYGTNEIAIGEYIGNCVDGCPMAIFYDEVYADSTLSRVMIADAPTWSAVTDLNMQIPESWSDTSVTVEVNTGQYADASIVYLYVSDESGNINATGFPVTVASTTGNPSAPGRPQNMSAVER